MCATVWHRLSMYAAVLGLAAVVAVFDAVADDDEEPPHRDATTSSTAKAAQPTLTRAKGAFVSDAVLIAAWPDQILVRASDGDLLNIYLSPESPATQICRGSCDATWRALKVGDLIMSSYERQTKDGRRTARWINANLVSDYAVIDGISGPVLVVHSTRHPEVPGSDAPYFLVVGSETIIEPATSDGTETVGRYPGARVGDSIYYVGSTDKPESMAIVLAGRISPLVSPPVR